MSFGDFDVLRGSVNLLREQRIDFVEVEAGMHRDNTRHVPAEALKGYLEDCGYNLFGVYEQVQEWTLGEARLRRSNLVFLSRAIMAQNRTKNTDEILKG